MSAARELKLARRAVRAAVTHLRQAQHLGTLDADTRVRVDSVAAVLGIEVSSVALCLERANRHLAKLRKERRP